MMTTRHEQSLRRRLLAVVKSSLVSNSHAAIDKPFFLLIRRHYHPSPTRSAPYSDTSRTSTLLTNDGIVEGVWMFCRHGDRSPGRPLSPPHRRDDEAAFWVTKLPIPHSADAFNTFSKRFPLHVLPGTNQGSFIDAARNPFGFLTHNGLLQLQETGRRFFNRYNHHGHHLPEQTEWQQQVALDFLAVWDMSVYSTNYLRTVMSVQSFLDGLLGTNCYPPVIDGVALRPLDPAITKESPVPDHSWSIKAEHYSEKKHGDDGQGVLVPVNVRDVSNDPLNAFDRNPDLVSELLREVMLSPEFQARDAEAAPLAARLANVLPGLIRPFRSNDYSRSPSGINWVEAADHFVCRQAHKLSLSAFSDFEQDDRVGPTLSAMCHPVLTHLAWRFREWYQNERLLAVIAAPPLREIADQLIATSQLSPRDRRPFVVYSCHDITLLGLLYAIRANFLYTEESGADWRYWPPYGSHLVFELVRIQTPVESDASHVIRVLLNGRPVLTLANEDNRSESPDYAGTGPERMLSVQDFLTLVKDLEDRGGFDYDVLLNKTTTPPSHQQQLHHDDL